MNAKSTSRNLINLIWMGCLITLIAYSQSIAQTAQLLADKVAYYPRVIKLAHNGSANGRILVSFDDAGAGVGSFYESTDNGSTWSASPVGVVTDNTPPRNCCSGFWEVPQQLGNTTEGTLFWATSVGSDQTRTACSIRLYKSTDVGRTWSYFSTVVSGNTGLWEPEFVVDSQGRLLCFFSTEEYKPTYNQALAYRISTDGGVTWGSDVIVAGDGNLRPGMAVVRKLPNGSYIMTYEVCNDGCVVKFKTSSNGYEWGAASNMGTKIVSTANRYFTNAPTVQWVADGTTNGKILVIGQVLRENTNGAIASSGNGATFMVNTTNGTGSWVEYTAPVSSPNDASDPCRNYTSQLVGINNGQQVLGLALRDNGDGKGCRLYYGTGSLTSVVTSSIVSGNYYRFINKADPNRVLHLTGDTYQSFTDVYKVVGSPKSWDATYQQWKVVDAGSGYYRLINRNDANRALHLTSETYLNFTDVYKVVGTPTAWTGAQAQLWKIEAAGNGYYKLINKADANRALHLTGEKYLNFTDVYDIVGTPTAWTGAQEQLWSLEDRGASGARVAAQTDPTDERLQTLQAYPNPADEELTIRFDAQQTERVSIGLVNTLGVSVKRVFEGNVTAGERKQITLSTAKLTAGTYFISVEKPTGKQTAKVLIIH